MGQDLIWNTVISNTFCFIALKCWPNSKFLSKFSNKIWPKCSHLIRHMEKWQNAIEETWFQCHYFVSNFNAGLEFGSELIRAFMNFLKCMSVNFANIDNQQILSHIPRSSSIGTNLLVFASFGAFHVWSLWNPSKSLN